MREPIPKPEKREKQPKPLQRKTPLRPFKLDKNGIPILKPPTAPKPRVAKIQKKKDPSDTRKIQWWHRDDPMWNMTRRLWFMQNPPPFGEYYQCALCPYMVHRSETTLDHIETRSSRPDLKYILSNLQPAHGVCNVRRGSMTMEAYWRRYPIGSLAPPQI